MYIYDINLKYVLNMKNKIFTLALTLMGSSLMFAQQWTGTNNTTSNISRTGKVTIGSAFSGSTHMLSLQGTMGISGSPSQEPYVTFYTNNSPQFVIGTKGYVYSNNGQTVISSAFYLGQNNILTGSHMPRLTIVGEKIGIGTENMFCTDCTDYRLFVKDGIRTEKIKVDIAANNGWADYVFEPDYNLMPLTQVEQFIKQNGHLPEVPTTAEAIENGIELKEMNILLLKKVEELTLYSIELQKRIEALESKTTK